MQPRKLVILALAILSSSGVSCAKGTGLGEDTEGGDGGSGAGSSSDGGGGSNAQASNQASSGVSSASATGSGGSGGGPCTEMPCKLVAPQCGCDAGQACSIQLPTTANPNGRFCAPEGPAKIAEVCTGANQCVSGALCVQASTTVSTCLKFCDSDSMCNAPGGLCAVKLNDGKGMGGTIPEAKLCSDNCDLPTSTGCPVPGTSCQVGREDDGQMRFFSMCRGAGAGVQGAACTSSDNCAVGYGCFTNNTTMVMQCFKYCNVTANSGCIGATICSPFTDPILIGPTEFGACT